jgi:hypothetical protein
MYSGRSKGGSEIEVGDVEGAELGAFAGENAVDHELNKFEGSSFGANIDVSY